MEKTVKSLVAAHMEFWCICKGERSQLAAYFQLSKAWWAVKLIVLLCVQIKKLESSSVYLREYMHRACVYEYYSEVKISVKRNKKMRRKKYVSTISWGIFPPVCKQKYPPFICPLRHFQINCFLIIKQTTTRTHTHKPYQFKTLHCICCISREKMRQ